MHACMHSFIHSFVHSHTKKTITSLRLHQSDNPCCGAEYDPTQVTLLAVCCRFSLCGFLLFAFFPFCCCCASCFLALLFTFILSPRLVLLALALSQSVSQHDDGAGLNGLNEE